MPLIRVLKVKCVFGQRMFVESIKFSGLCSESSDFSWLSGSSRSQLYG